MQITAAVFSRGLSLAHRLPRQLLSAPSHSFVRREIAGVEAAGLSVLRYSIRPAPDALPDPRDAAEREVTTTVLAHGTFALMGAFLIER